MSDNRIEDFPEGVGRWLDGQLAVFMKGDGMHGASEVLWAEGEKGHYGDTPEKAFKRLGDTLKGLRVPNVRKMTRAEIAFLLELAKTTQPDIEAGSEIEGGMKTTDRGDLEILLAALGGRA